MGFVGSNGVFQCLWAVACANQLAPTGQCAIPEMEIALGDINVG